MFTYERSIHSLIPRSHSITWSAMEWGLGMRQLQHKLRIKSVSFLPIWQHKLPQYSFSFCSLLQLCGPALVSALPPSAFPPHHCWHPAHKSKKTQHNAVESTRPSTWQASLVPRLFPCEQNVLQATESWGGGSGDEVNDKLQAQCESYTHQ